jgi:Ca-activated chloride channel family protein
MSQLDIRYHHVTVKIQDQVAVTHVDQVFYNSNKWAVEGTYIFPLPVDAAVTSFTLWMDGQPVQGQVLDAEQARQTYQEIVSQLRDPALLEYAGRGAVQARIFPIPPQGERRVELEYVQTLTAENGLVRYVYPLNTEKFSAKPLESVSVSVDVRSSQPIRAVYSPTHPVDVNRDGENHVSAGYEASQALPEMDFALYYSLGETTAFHLLTFQDSQDGADSDGYFLALLAPQPRVDSQALPKDVILVLDHSGSMEGDKFHQAQDALRFILGALNPQDRFNLVVFSTGVDTYASRLRPASEAGEAQKWADTLTARGSTDINRALLEAAAMPTGEGDNQRPAYMIFLTDGLPTEGVRDSQKIIANLAAAAPANLRLFAFGVGYDVDTFLLDSLAQAHHGSSMYVLPEERLDEKLSTFYSRINTPVLTDISLDFGAVSVYDLYPSPLPDLFSGSQIVVVGRYRQGGSTDVTLTGTVNGQTQSFQFPDQDFAAKINPQSSIFNLQSEIPRLWATRKIGYLLNQVRLHGPDRETVDQIVRLSIRYGIVTPYTSYLVTEPAALGAEEQGRIIQDQMNQMQTQAPAPSSGRAAVEKAAGQGSLAEAQAPAPAQAEAAGQVHIVGSRTFILSGGKWIDTAFDPKTMETVKVVFLSEDYYMLAGSQPALAAAFALGQAVIAFSDGVAYEVITNGSDSPPVVSPSMAPPSPTVPSPVGAPTPTVQPTPSLPKTSTASNPCIGWLLPLALFVLAAGWVRYRRQ